MIDLRKDFENRIENGNQKLFSTISGKSFFCKEIKFYFFYILRKIKKNQQNIALICDSTIESHILSIFFIFSRYNLYLLNSSTYINLHLIEKPFVIVLNNEIYDLIAKEKGIEGIIIAPFLEDFQQFCHPSFDIERVSEEYYKYKNIGKSIFCSSGSTGKPKMIPLTYEQINSCYLNVNSGFLNSLFFKKILSVHDSSFVIILPFIFCLALKKDSQIVANESSSKINPIIKLSSNIKSFEEHIIISVPSVFRLLIKLSKNNFQEFIKKGHIISCGEPLDKKLAIHINDLNPYSFHNLYGSTEVAPWILKLNIKKYLSSFSSFEKIPIILPVGSNLPNVKLKISDQSELLVCSKSVFNGYEVQTNKETFDYIDDQTFFKTGDHFEIVDNLYFCKGRKNSSLKIAGAFVNPIFLEYEIKSKTSIENLLLIPNITDAKLNIVIFNAPDEKDYDLITKFFPLIKRIINSNSSTSITTEFLINKDPIKYLKSGKINRNFYKEKYLLKDFK